MDAFPRTWLVIRSTCVWIFVYLGAKFMKHFASRSLTTVLALGLGLTSYSISSLAQDQTAPDPAVVKRPAKPARAQRAAKAPAPKATPTVPPANPQSAPPAPVAAATPGTVANRVMGRSAPGAPASSAVAADPRSPVALQGVGTFHGAGGWTLTAYGCFRTGTRLLCDFDAAPPRNHQVNANAFSRWVNLVDDGGKITGAHNAFFQATDGSQLNVAYAATDSPVRLFLEYDNVPANFTTVSLVHGRDRIQSVPVTAVNPTPPAGTAPATAKAPN